MEDHGKCNVECLRYRLWVERQVVKNLFIQNGVDA